MQIRNAVPGDVVRLAEIWHSGYHEAHAALLPASLTRLRTVGSLTERLHDDLSRTRVADSGGVARGFCVTKGNELYQIFVESTARGSGIAESLLHDAEQRLTLEGVERAFLACAIGNVRAARFYEKRGWHHSGNFLNKVTAADQNFSIEVWRFEKNLLEPTTVR
jgi:GNAT superfamily N-acetyltransferase